LRGALNSVRESVSDLLDFNPATSTLQFFIGIAQPLGPMIALRLRERLTRAAPGIVVVT
jgi:hypothetical protein